MKGNSGSHNPAILDGNLDASQKEDPDTVVTGYRLLYCNSASGRRLCLCLPNRRFLMPQQIDFKQTTTYMCLGTQENIIQVTMNYLFIFGQTKAGVLKLYRARDPSQCRNLSQPRHKCKHRLLSICSVRCFLTILCLKHPVLILQQHLVVYCPL